MPTSLTTLEFEKLLERLLAGFPAQFRERMRNLEISVEPVAPDPDLLGLFEGAPLTERSVTDPLTMPCRIRLFQQPHEEMSNNFAELEKNVLDTLWHEIGHYFGLSEAEVGRQERRRKRYDDVRRTVQRKPRRPGGWPS